MYPADLDYPGSQALAPRQGAFLLAAAGIAGAIALSAWAVSRPAGPALPQVPLPRAPLLPALARKASATGEVARGWLSTLLGKTSKHEGKYWSVQQNIDGNGASYGILQWTQRAGGLGTVLAAMRQADPVAFDTAMEGTRNGEAIVAHAQRKDMGPMPDGRLLWESPWVDRLRAAGRVPSLQRAQRHVAVTGEHMACAVDVARVLGLSSERSMVMAYNRTVHQGCGGAMSVARRLARFYADNPSQRPLAENGVLVQYAWLAANRFRRTSFPEKSLGASRWVELPPGDLELDIEATPGGAARLYRRAQQGPTWHAVAGHWDLYDLILRRSAEIANDIALRDVPVDMAELASARAGADVPMALVA